MPARKIPEKPKTETFMVCKLPEVDEETLYYWVKSVTGVWPISIHMSENDDKAVVKVPIGKIGE